MVRAKTNSTLKITGKDKFSIKRTYLKELLYDAHHHRVLNSALFHKDCYMACVRYWKKQKLPKLLQDSPCSSTI